MRIILSNNLWGIPLGADKAKSLCHFPAKYGILSFEIGGHIIRQTYKSMAIAVVVYDACPYESFILFKESITLFKL